MAKSVLLSWSGGVDSTALIIQYLNKGYKVDALPVIMKNNVNKNIREKRARTALMKNYFKNYSVNLMISLTVAEFGSFGYLTLKQMPLWILGLVCALDSSHDEVAIGIVMNDDAVSCMEEIKALYYGYQGLVNIPLPPLVFPLIKFKKEVLYENIPVSIRKHLTWCENSEKEDMCGVCIPCKRMISLGLQEPPQEPKKKLTANRKTSSKHNTIVRVKKC